MQKLNSEDAAIFEALDDTKTEVVDLIDKWLDDQTLSVEPIVQGVRALVDNDKTQASDDPIEQMNDLNRLQAMRMFIPTTGISMFIRSPEGMLVALVRLAGI
jgi:hypothetical protein